jgi:hypothetical protein
MIYNFCIVVICTLDDLELVHCHDVYIGMVCTVIMLCLLLCKEAAAEAFHTHGCKPKMGHIPITYFLMCYFLYMN